VQRREAVGPLGPAVRDQQRPSPGPGECGERQAAHRPGAYDERRAARDSAGDQRQRCADNALPGPVDPGLGVHPLSDPKGLLHQLVQKAPGGVGLGRHGIRIPELTQNLCLADHHRVQTGADPKGVAHSLAVVVDVQVRRESPDVEAGSPGEDRTDLRQPAVKRSHRGVDLDPVAR
jgi:hypothetical protein